MKIFLDIEHGIPVFNTREISSSWLSISIEEAVICSYQTENSMHDSVQVGSVPLLLLRCHVSPVLNTRPCGLFGIHEARNQYVMKSKEYEEPE